MFFLVDDKLKIIFGWSAKCGCSHIKKIFWFLQNNIEDNKIHIQEEYDMRLPDDISNYNVIIIIRNPYERIISGFLEKYKINGHCRNMWKYDNITFSMFINELINNNWDIIDKHHFTPQTTEYFDKNKLLEAKSLKIFDIKNINYEYIENFYEKKNT